MSIRVQEKRQSLRVPAAYPAVVLDRKGHALARGRTANISENGVLVLVNPRREIVPEETVILELSVPSTSSRTRDNARRVVRYRCRVVHIQRLGHLLGVGVEFLAKIC
jgi:hypothetical protein